MKKQRHCFERCGVTFFLFFSYRVCFCGNIGNFFSDGFEWEWKCISLWPEDGRPYVVLGKILSKQSKTGEAREIYEKGCQATQGENAYIWQVSVQVCFACTVCFASFKSCLFNKIILVICLIS